MVTILKYVLSVHMVTLDKKENKKWAWDRGGERIMRQRMIRKNGGKRAWK